MVIDVRTDVLVGIYHNAYRTLLQRIVTMDARGNVTDYERALLRETAAILNELDNDARQWIEREIPRVYMNGQSEAIRALSEQGVNTQGLSARITGVHRSAVETIAHNMYADLRSAEQLVGRRVADAFRQAGIEAIAQKVPTGQTVQQTKRHLQDILGQRGLTAFVDERGREWRLDSYAEMVARTTTRETTNLGTFNQLRDLSYDLVQMSTHFPTCDICSQYQGRIYSLSGEDARFPALYETALSEGFHTLHPHCRHVLTPWVEELATEDERRKALSDAGKPFEDTRSQRELNAYRKEQQRKRWQRDTKLMHEKYSALLPNDTPTPGAFARMRQADSERWYELQLLYRDARTELR